MDRQNTGDKSINDDSVLLGAKATTFAPTLVELYGRLDLDFVWLDFEHSGPSPYDSTVFEKLSRAATVVDIELLVRLPSGDPPLIRKVLDAGIRNILVPRVETANEVRQAVRAARFEYEGKPGGRGVGAAYTSDWGERMNPAYAESEDNAVSVGVVIENQTAVESIDDIVSVSGLDFVFIGPADLSVSIGHPLETDAESVKKLVERVRRVAQEADISVGTVARSEEQIKRAVEQGYQLLYIGDEFSSARKVLSDRIETTNEYLNSE
jgi:2-dehydro-3-deoxyglucarate aldolase